MVNITHTIAAAGGLLGIINYQGQQLNLVQEMGGYGVGRNPAIGWSGNVSINTNAQWKFISTSVANEYQIMNNAAPSSYLTYVQAANMAGHAQAVGTPGVPTTFLISTITLGQSPVTITDVATGLVLTAWVNPDPAHRSDTSTPVTFEYAAPGSIQQAWTLQSF